MLLHLSPFKKRTTAWLLAAILFFSNCYSYKVATHAQAGTETSTVTANAYLWGLIQKPALIHTPVCDSLGVNGISEVVVKTNLGYALITVATLGIWCPVKIQWKCSKPCKKSGTL